MPFGSGSRRRRVLRAAAYTVGLVGIIVAGGIVTSRLHTAALVGLGTRPPPVDLGGPGPVYSDPVQLATTAGHPVIVEFFEAGCSVCRQTAPDLCTALHDHGEVVVVAVDAALEGEPAIAGFVRDHLAACAADGRLHVLADPCRPPGASPCGNVSAAWGVDVVPTVYVVDTAGRVAYAGTGVGAPSGAAHALAGIPHG